MTTRALAIYSGGLDSTVLAKHLAKSCDELHLVSFDYGQKHRKELVYAEQNGGRIAKTWRLIDLSGIGLHLRSALTDKAAPVPEGHYAQDNMKATVVPNRNAIMLSVATGIALSLNCQTVAFGAHGGDHFIYPDCRPGFVQAFEAAMQLGNEGFYHGSFHVYAPFLAWSKADIVRYGSMIGVDFAQTWSCYKGGDIHCGVCGTCYERREAFVLAGVEDPTEYEDSTTVFAVPAAVAVPAENAATTAARLALGLGDKP